MLLQANQNLLETVFLKLLGDKAHTSVVIGLVCHVQLNRDLDFLGDHPVSTIIDNLDLLKNVAVLIHRLSRVEDSVLDPSIVPPIFQLELVDQSIET